MCKSTDCAGCAYSKLPALFHNGPQRECYRRFFVRHLPWNVAEKWIRTMLRGEATADGPARNQSEHQMGQAPFSLR